MNIVRTALFAIAFFMMGSVCVLVADFVVQPKKKTPSVGKIKEQCMQELGDQLERFAHIMELLGKVQSKIVEHTYALLENDKEHALQQKNNVELERCHAMMCTFNESLSKMEQQLQEYHCFMQQLK